MVILTYIGKVGVIVLGFMSYFTLIYQNSTITKISKANYVITNRYII